MSPRFMRACRCHATHCSVGGMTPEIDTTDDTAPADAPLAETNPYRVAFAVLICCTVLVALVSFALSFYGLNDYGRTVMRLPVWLSPLVPLGVDLFSLCGIAATYLLRRAPGQVRAYSWLVFLVPTGLSVAGNLAHGESRSLARAGLVGAAVAPVILALATHLVVVVRRHLETASVPDSGDGAAEVATEPEFVHFIAPEPMRLNGNGAGPGTDSASDSVQARALVLLLGDRTVSEVAAEIGVDPRTVQRWADKIHERARPRKSGARRPAGGASDGSN